MTCNDEVRSFAIWCIDTNLLKWLVNKKLKPYGLQLIKEMRDKNDDRDESSFRKIYIDNGKPFIGRENPIKIHDRLHLQHGLFLCPNNGIQSFHDNILAFNTESELNAIYKIEFTMEFNVVRNVLEEFRRMNISRESLFPGLDGFAQSMKYHLLHYRNQCLLRKGVVG
jgi:hypothetical protein